MSPLNREKLKNLPTTPGVYYYYDKGGKLLYVGKAASLKSRVSSYFLRTVYDNKTQALVDRIADLKFRQTDSVLEALILEANEIKKYQPPYNIRAKDDKTFVNIIVTKEEFPRILVARPTEDLGVAFKKVYGPYTSAKSAREAVRIIRKIIPFHSRNEKSEKKCLDFHIGLCPGPYAGAISREEYLKNIRRIQMILEGKKTSLIRDFEKEMKKFSKAHEYEEAAAVRDKIFALRHVQDVALLSSSEMPAFKAENEVYEEPENSQSSKSKVCPEPDDWIQRSKLEEIKTEERTGKIYRGKLPKDLGILRPPVVRAQNDAPGKNYYHRIEAYDISNISGMYAVGSMVVFHDGEIAKGEYRKFKIRTIEQANDVGMMKEVLTRRLKHDEWTMPDLILLDGGQAQVNGAQEILDQYNLNILAIGVAKGPTRKGLDLYFSGKWKSTIENKKLNRASITPFEKGGKGDLLVGRHTDMELQNKEIVLDKKIIAHIMSEAHRFAISYHRVLRKKGYFSGKSEP